MARKSKKVSALKKAVNSVKSAPSKALVLVNTTFAKTTSGVRSLAALVSPFRAAPVAQVKKASKARSKKR